MTYAPQTLTDLGHLWTTHGGTNLGIVGDTAHQHTGTSYHLGKDSLVAGAYSATLPRDKAGLTNAASAIDLGKLAGSLGGLQVFSRWLVTAIRANPRAYRDIREVIYSPDGKVVRRWDNDLHVMRIGGDGTGQGDNTHLYHTHISFYRDSETRDKRPLFAPYFELPDTATEDPVGIPVHYDITAGGNPLAALATAKIKGANHVIFDEATGASVKVADGLDLKTVQKGQIVGPLPGWADNDPHVVGFGYNGRQHIAVIRDVVLGPGPDPTAAVVKAARGAALEQAHGAAIKGAGDAIDALPR